MGYRDMTEAVKGKLQVTWSDEDTDARIEELMADVAAALAFKVGRPAGYDFSENPYDRGLYLNACWYEWQNASAEFDENYMNDLMQARMRAETEAEQDAED